MGIIALIIFGFLVLAFILIFRKRHDDSVQRMMKQNHNVMPLFKEKSARIKYHTLHKVLKHDPTPLQTLEQLQRDYNDKLVDIEVYYDALEELEQQYLKH
ncbi:MAG: hypothetical protein V4592_05675 [Bacteroidota bacterium]